MLNRINSLVDSAHGLILLTTLAVAAASSATTLAQEFKFLEVNVVDENGKPMADVPVEIKMDGLVFPMPTNEAGVISLNVSAASRNVQLKVNQPDYEPQKIRWRRGTEVPAKYSIKMQLGKPSQGWVFDAQGNPVSEAEIYTALPGETLTFLNGKNPPKSNQTATKTDAQGKFTLPYLPQGSTIVCLSEQGWAQRVKPKADAQQPLEMRLTPWVQVELLTKHSKTPVGLHYLSRPHDNGKKVRWLYRGVTDQQKKHICQRVILGTAMAYQKAALRPIEEQPKLENRSHGFVTAVEPNTRLQIAIGLAKQKATGKIMLPADYFGQAFWETGYVVLTENNVVTLTMRTMIFEYGKLLSQSGVMDPTQRVPPTLQPNYVVQYLAPIQSDGSFVIEGIPAGQYKLSAVLAAQPAHDNTKTDIFSLEEVGFRIPESTDEEPFDLSEHILEHADQFTKSAE